jgi:hypothetical protein
VTAPRLATGARAVRRGVAFAALLVLAGRTAAAQPRASTGGGALLAAPDARPDSLLGRALDAEGAGRAADAAVL